MTKNIQISFRLTEYQLAHGLEIIRGLESNYQPQSLSAMVKMIYQDWLAKLSAATSPWPQDSTVMEIKKIMASTAAGRKASRQGSSDTQILAKIIKATYSKPAGPTEKRPKNKDIKSQCQAPGSVKTESIKTVVTDFSPLTFDELTNNEENDK